jgi:arginyl-tRNA synthetase
MRESIAQIVSDTLHALKKDGRVSVAEIPSVVIETPKNPEHGDYASNIAMVLSKKASMKPRDLAELIKTHLVDPKGTLAAVEIAGPGFINFRLSERAVREVVRDVLKLGDNFGRRAPKSGPRVNVEFVSANPTGPLHLGHARGAFFGDAVARVLEAAGYDVTREFYVNDFGKQVETLGRSVHTRYRELFGEQVTLEKGEYPAPYVIDIAQRLKDEDGDRWLARPESEWLPRAIAIGIDENLKSIRASLEKAGIRHDVWARESTLHESGRVLAIVDSYRARGVTYEAEHARGTEDKVRRDDSKAATFADRQKGGTFLTTTAHGDEEDRIILRADGTPVYLTADLAYHAEKADRGFTRVIDVWGADHAGHVPRIRAGMTALGRDPKTFEFLLVQMVRLLKGDEEIKISKRSGQLYELSELIDDVGADVVRFIFLMRAATTQFDFDLELATKQSNENPVFYCQMGHARCVNVLKKAEEKGHPFRGISVLDDDTLALLSLPEERAMLLQIAGFGDVIGSAADAREPHRVLYYAQDLIADFHSYFTRYKHTHRIVTDDAATTQARLGLVAALRQTLKSALNVLGLTAPEWMEPPKDVEEAEA